MWSKIFSFDTNVYFSRKVNSIQCRWKNKEKKFNSAPAVSIYQKKKLMKKTVVVSQQTKTQLSSFSSYRDNRWNLSSFISSRKKSHKDLYFINCSYTSPSGTNSKLVVCFQLKYYFPRASNWESFILLSLF